MQAVASLEDMIDEIRPGLLRTRTERAPIAELINTTVIETSVAAERAVLDAEHAAAVSEACERAGSDAGFSNGSFLDMYRETSSNGVEQQGSPTTAQSAPQARGQAARGAAHQEGPSGPHAQIGRTATGPQPSQPPSGDPDNTGVLETSPSSDSISASEAASARAEPAAPPGPPRQAAAAAKDRRRDDRDLASKRALLAATGAIGALGRGSDDVMPLADMVQEMESWDAVSEQSEQSRSPATHT